MQGRGFCPECLGKTIVLSNSLGDNDSAVSHGRGTQTMLFHIFPPHGRGCKKQQIRPYGVVSLKELRKK